MSAARGFVIQDDAAFDAAGTIQDDAAFDAAGTSVSAAGGVNGDGFADVIVGASGNNDGGYSAGAASVLFGGADGFGMAVGGRQVVDLTTPSAAEGSGRLFFGGR